jgi:KDO2-lipid IV(A) lauroyltransferase
MTMSASPASLRAPRYWPSWLGVGFIWLLAQLPWAIQRRLGAGLGWLAFHLLRQRVDDTRINLRLCFPEKNEAEREAMVRDVFRNAGLTIFETANAWFRPVEHYRAGTLYEGLEHLRALQEQGRPILILGAHYSMLDLGATISGLFFHVNFVYRPQKNPVINHVMIKGRSRGGHKAVANDDMRALIRALKKNEIVWYATDQDYGLRHAVFTPFFGNTAASITTPSRMARMNDAALLLIQYNRIGDSDRYHFRLTAPLENFPSANGDDEADTARLNAEVEKMIRIAPTQYMWYHRRFKTQPPGGKSPYTPKRKEIRRQRAAEAAARAQEKA